MEHTLFVYGILRRHETVASIIGHSYTGTMVEAILPDHVVVRDMGPAYLFEAPGEIAEGVLIDGLSDADIAAIDRIEGTEHGHYVRKPVTVLVHTNGDEPGEAVETEAYLAGPSRIGAWRKRSTYAEYTRELRKEWDANAERIEVEDNIALDDALLTVDVPTVRLENPPHGEGEDANVALEAYLAMNEYGCNNDAADDFDGSYGDATKTLPIDREPFRPVYPGTEAHLPDRRGFGLASGKRTTDTPGDAVHSIFVYDKLRSLDCLEMVIDREWFGTREPGSVSGYVRMNAFPPFAVPSEDPDAEVLGHLLNGITAADLIALDRYMNVSSGMYRRKTVRFGKKKVILWVAGNKAEEILAMAKEHSKLAKRARREAELRRERKRARRAAKTATAKTSPAGAASGTVATANSSAVTTRAMTKADHDLWGKPNSKVSWMPTPLNGRSNT